MQGPAFRALPLPLIQPQLIERVLACRAGPARRIPPIHLDEDLAVPVALVGELPAQFAERHILERAGVQSARKSLDVQVLNADQIELSHQTRSEEHTSELQSPCNLVCRLLLEKKKNN